MFKFKTAVQSALNILLTHINCGKCQSLVGAALSLGFALALSQATYGSAVLPQTNVTLSPEQMGEFFNREERRRAQEACNAATRSWSEVGRRFGTACSEANLNQGGNQNEGHINCSLEVQRCMHCDIEKEDSSQFARFNCDEVTSSSGESGGGVIEGVLRGTADALSGQRASDNRNLQNIRRQRRQFEFCPARAGEDLDKKIQNTEKARESMQKQEDDLLKLQENFEKVQQDGEEKLKDIAERVEDLGTEYQEQTVALQERLQEQESELAERVIELEGQFQQSQQAMTTLAVAREQANNEFLDGLAELERACHSHALAQMTEWSKNRQDRINSNTYGGNVNQLYQGANQSLVDRAQKRAEHLYRSCTRDQSFTSRRESLRRQREFKLRQAQQQQEALIQAQKSITESIKRLQTETRNQILQRNIQQMERLMSNYQREYSRLAQRHAQEQVKLQQTLMRMSQEMQLAQTRLATARSEYFELESLSELAKSRSGGESTKKGAVAKATAEMGNLASEARIVWSACQCGGNESSRGHELDRTQCQRVGEFLKANFNESLSPYSAPATETVQGGEALR